MQTEKIDLLATALVAAQAELTAVQMDKENPYFHSKYASLGALISASRPVLSKHKLAIVQWIMSAGNLIGVATSIIHESGQMMQETTWLPLSGNAKNVAQEAGQITSYLRRYAYASVLGLYAEEDTDAEGVPSQVKHAEALGGVEVFTPEQITPLLQAKLFENSFAATNALKHSEELKPGVTGMAGMVFWGGKYREKRIQGSSTEEAAKYADEEYAAEKARKLQDKGAGA